MERVAFLVESTGDRLGCLLNPESLVVQRSAGVRRRRSSRGALHGGDLTDDPLLYTGGGTTMLHLDLLFDVSIAGSSIETDDVRWLTAPLWQLAENRGQAGDGGPLVPAEQQMTGNPAVAGAGADTMMDGRSPRGLSRVPTVTFVWGKAWNIPGIVVSVAERLEYFTIGGAPQRSWLRMRLLRVPRPGGQRPPEPAFPTIPPDMAGWAEEGMEPHPALPPAEEITEDLPTHQVLGGSSEEGGTSERLDEIAHRYYGQPSLWRLLAAFNGIDDPMRLPAGLLLRIPPLSLLKRGWT